MQWCNKATKTQAIIVYTSVDNSLVAIAFGGLIEILQLELFTWRSAEWSDFFCDGLGACMGIFGVMLTVSAIGNEKSKLIIIAAAILLTGFSSCGIFKKGCGCPTFGARKVAGPETGPKAVGFF